MTINHVTKNKSTARLFALTASATSMLCMGCYLAHDPDSDPVDRGDGGPADGATLRDRGVPADASSLGDTSADGSYDGGEQTCELPRWATSVVDFAFGTGQSHNQATRFPAAVLGPPMASDLDSVVSLGNGGFVTLRFDRVIVDGPGPDFIVFENPLPGFAELATVAISADGVSWHEFPCTAPLLGPDFGSCAGVGVVHASPTNDVSPFDPTTAGGDAFDLASVALTSASFVRITDRADLDGPRGVFDLDAVTLVHSVCP